MMISTREFRRPDGLGKHGEGNARTDLTPRHALLRVPRFAMSSSLVPYRQAFSRSAHPCIDRTFYTTPLRFLLSTPIPRRAES